MGIGLKVAFVTFFVILSISVLLNVYFYTFQEEINNLKKPKLVAVVQGSDERPLLQSSFLHLTGYVFNVGKDIARDCSLHVILYQGNVVAVDTYIRLGNINGEKGISVDDEIYYQGASLTDYSITPEY